jgi:hypothetical protein
MTMAKKKCITKDGYDKLIKESDSFIIIFNESDGNEVSFLEHNIDRGQMITACEVVKHKVLQMCISGDKKKNK